MLQNTLFQVKALLKKALVERTEDITEKEAAEEEFNIHLEVSDLTTTHEAYQFLLRRYVQEGHSSEMGTFLDMEKLKARHKRRSSLQPPTIEMQNLISPETEEKRDKAFDKLKTFIRMKDEHNEEKKFEEATKIMKECLDVKPARNKYNPNRRRSSILLSIQRDLDEEMDDLKLSKKHRSGSRSRRNSSVGNLSKSTQNLKTSEEDLQSSTEALVLPPSKPRSRRGSTVGLEPKESDGSTEALTLPDIDNFQRSSSRKSRKSFKKKKKGGDDNGDPYPKRKGSFRRYSLAPEAAL